MKDSDFLFLASMLRARETGMLKGDKINRMLDAPGFDEAAKLLLDCGYPDMTEMNMAQIESVLNRHRSNIYYEISNFGYARDLLDIFRIKYDYHNVKVLVKSMGANVDSSYLLSDSGRIDIEALNEAFITGQRTDLPPPVAAAMSAAVGILSRTKNPQLADIRIDKAWFGELLLLANGLKNDFITGFVRLQIDNSNLSTIVRSKRAGRSKDFLAGALIQGGSVDTDKLAASYNENAIALFTDGALVNAARLGYGVMEGGAQTLFELACDNALLYYATNTVYISFGPAPVIAYLAKLDWELTVIRMILTGKLTGISPDVIRERLRDCRV